MKQLTEFFHTHRYVITWTMCYVAMMWAILFFLFDFHLFSGAHWHRLMHAHLRGFPGFVFGILMLAALPLYAATTTLIVRTGKPLFTITRPSWLPKWPTGKKPVTPAPAAAAEPPREKAPQKPLPADLPNELRGAFLRAREIAAAAPIPTISAPKPTDAPAQSEQPAAATTVTPAAETSAPPAPASDNQLQPDGLPLPPDFDFGPATPDTAAAPVFTEINFDTPSSARPTSPIAAKLESMGHTPRTIGEIFVTETMAIATHDDSDFWIADGDEWFASGKQKPSPVTAVLQVASDLGIAPVLYLGARNIMDLDTYMAQWRDRGVRIITDIEEL